MIVATIGSIYRDAHLLGNIKVVVVDECHLINPDGAEAGRFRKFLTELARLCSFRIVGYTATPFRGNGVWLTDGKDPLFTGIACTVTAQELLNSGHLAPLVRPIDAMATRINTDGIKTTSGDYNLDELAERVSEYLPPPRPGVRPGRRAQEVDCLLCHGGERRNTGRPAARSRHRHGAGLRRNTRRRARQNTSLISAPGACAAS